MLTASILFLALAVLCGGYGVLTYLSNAPFCTQEGLFDSAFTGIWTNPGFVWMVAAGIVLILSGILLFVTLKTRKQDRFGKKLPLYVTEISTALFGAAMALSAIYTNFTFGYYVQLAETNDYVESIVPIVAGAILFAIGIVFLFIQILKGLSESFSLKCEKSRIYGFFRDYKSEMKKIVWSSKEDVAKNTVMVVITLVIVGALVALIDLGFTRLLLLISNIASGN